MPAAHAVLEPRHAARPVARLLLVAVLVSLCPAPAVAFTILNADRGVDVGGSVLLPDWGPVPCGDSISSPSTGVFDQTLVGCGGSTATQLSTLDTIEFSGTGDIALSWGSDTDTATSHLFVDFEVEQAGAYALTGEIDESNSFASLGYTFVRLVEGGYLFGAGGVELFDVQSEGVFEQLFLLQPGVKYSLLAQTHAATTEDTSAWSSWSVALVPVPEPGSGVLLGLGLLQLARRRRSGRLAAFVIEARARQSEIMGSTPLARSARVVARGVLASLAALIISSPARAEVLDFETQTPGDFGASIVEGDYEFTTSNGSIEPGGTFCSFYPSCSGTTSQFIASVGGAPITFGRVDGEPFALHSLSTLSVFVGSVFVTGTTASGTIAQRFDVGSAGFEARVPTGFVGLLSVTVTPEGPLGLDDIEVGPGPHVPVVPPSALWALTSALAGLGALRLRRRT